jgi:hypothetical protein
MTLEITPIEHRTGIVVVEFVSTLGCKKGTQKPIVVGEHE